MAKKVNKTEEQFANVEENLSKAGLYVVENSKKLTSLILAIVIIFTLIIGYNNFFLEPNEKNASSEMYIAEFFFQNNEYEKALNGDSTMSINEIGDTIKLFHKGFIKIAEEYSNTKSGNLANYYAAICQINLGSSLDSTQYFKDALNSLNNFETDDEIIYSLATGLKGDANMELKDTIKAIGFYKSAANDYINSFTTPYFMMKEAKIHDNQKNFSLSLQIYNRIKSDYPESKEGKNIDKYISSSSNR
tara:strand:- start:101 stop:841 length:741 start_codon:yes stop_codon:yes gene_type:complete